MCSKASMRLRKSGGSSCINLTLGLGLVGLRLYNPTRPEVEEVVAEVSKGMLANLLGDLQSQFIPLPTNQLPTSAAQHTGLLLRNLD